MPYMYIALGVALLIASALWWLMSTRQTAANQAQTKRTQVAQKARLARLKPAEEATAAKKPRDTRRAFGNR